ncbi:putative membrane protein [Clostridium bornimense]|uniref:Putative membrane protein n=1 Tax=Clostridium bornimense TaxID=1216932 RepID=W6S2T3_9CLOT|nr:ABC-2 transporter permease [Clostridium bornimense]CDM70219.1 putative membrane protein [Clostridium bornimense]
MKGLLLKDILNFKKQGLMFIFLIALWFFIGIKNKDIYYLSGIIAMLTLLIPITVISYDEKAKWERYALTMPISKGTIVISRYVLTICVSVIGGILSTIAGLIISTNIKEVLLINMSVISLGLLVISFAFPFIFKYGVDKGRIIMVILFVVPTLFLTFASEFKIAMPSEEVIMQFIYFLPLVVLVIIICSIQVSKMIYSKKEF